MAGAKPDNNTEEFIQARLEIQICEQYDLHDWATAVSVANPIDILIMFEDQDEDFDPKTLN